MMAAPRCCTVLMNSPRSQPSSPTAALIACPATLPCATSGNWLLLWLPQMITLRTALTC
jgi:hypothetical protein